MQPYRFLDGVLKKNPISQDAARRQARLAVILENLEKDICYEHGEMCQTKADCWAKEIIAREPSWA